MPACSEKKPHVDPIPQASFPKIEPDRAFNEVKNFVALGPRDTGTVGAEKAAEYLLLRLKELNISADIDRFITKTPKGQTPLRNVVGSLPGRRKGLIIIGSHYDTKSGIGPDFEGANDSGSSSGLLLEMARVLRKKPEMRPDILVAFFDGEECMVRYGQHDGFHGSRYMAKKLLENGRAKEVVAVIILDMIGDRDLSVTIPRNGSSTLISAVLEAAHKEGVRTKFALVPFGIGDDHVPFLTAGMPAVDIIDFQYGSAPGKNDYWHTPEDRMDKISEESLKIVGNTILRVVYSLK